MLYNIVYFTVVGSEIFGGCKKQKANSPIEGAGGVTVEAIHRLYGV